MDELSIEQTAAGAQRARRVLVIGGAGVFGSAFCRLSVADGAQIWVAGRNAARATALSDRLGPSAASIELNRNASNLPDILRSISPDVVVDASGPFQSYSDPTAVARAALAVDADYVDLSDAVGFPEAIASLDAQAKSAGRVCLTGASTMPAITSAAADALVDGLQSVALIESALIPGNRAPRGLSIMGAILAQVGRPIPLWRGDRRTASPGWSETIGVSARGLGRRRASVIGAPDLTLFPERYRARSVLFRAGLELRLLHHGLRAAIPFGRIGLPLSRLAPIARRAAQLFEPFGTATGGLTVDVCGRDADGRAVRRRWSVIARSGDGPTIPAVPAAILVNRIDDAPRGARPCLGEPNLADIEAAFGALDVETGRTEAHEPRLFEAALGEDGWRRLPAQTRRLHDLWDRELWTGTASVERGGSLGAKIVAALFRFPRAADAVPVKVDMRRSGAREIWTRSFAGRRFQSVLGPKGPGELTERFGPFTFTLAVGVDPTGALTLEPTAGRLGPIPLPPWLTPRGVSFERAGPGGAFAFDVDIRLPGVGRVVRYRGQLAPAVK